jgi:hypothetical protein
MIETDKSSIAELTRSPPPENGAESLAKQSQKRLEVQNAQGQPDNDIETLGFTLRPVAGAPRKKALRTSRGSEGPRPPQRGATIVPAPRALGSRGHARARVSPKSPLSPRALPGPRRRATGRSLGLAPYSHLRHPRGPPTSAPGGLVREGFTLEASGSEKGFRGASPPSAGQPQSQHQEHLGPKGTRVPGSHPSRRFPHVPCKALEAGVPLSEPGLG